MYTERTLVSSSPDCRFEKRGQPFAKDIFVLTAESSRRDPGTPILAEGIEVIGIRTDFFKNRFFRQRALYFVVVEDQQL